MLEGNCRSVIAKGESVLSCPTSVAEWWLHQTSVLCLSICQAGKQTQVHAYLCHIASALPMLCGEQQPKIPHSALEFSTWPCPTTGSKQHLHQAKSGNLPLCPTRDYFQSPGSSQIWRQSPFSGLTRPQSSATITTQPQGTGSDPAQWKNLTPKSACL